VWCVFSGAKVRGVAPDDTDRLVPAARRWLFRGQDYAHPALRWLAGPVWRVGDLILFVIVFGVVTHVALGWRIAVGVVIAVSLIADIVNALILRKRRRARASIAEAANGRSELRSPGRGRVSINAEGRSRRSARQPGR
jgi:hypothetical protein